MIQFNKYYLFIILFFILTSCSTTEKINHQYKTEKELLVQTTKQINGTWKKVRKNIFITINISDENFAGTWTSKNYISSAPLIKLKIIEGNPNLIFSDIFGGDTFNIISINDDILIIRHQDGQSDKYHKVKKNVW